MNTPAANSAGHATDRIQQRLTSYACSLGYDDLTPEAIHAAKVRIIDTLGGLIGGFYGEPLRIARTLAAQMPSPGGATVIGTGMKTSPDMAAFVNASVPHQLEVQDIYHPPGSYEGHPSDVIMPVLAAAEHAQASGRELITGVVLAYEIFCRMCDVFHSSAFDYTNFACVGTAVAAGKVLGLSPEQLMHCISMAVVPNVILKQEKDNRLSMWKEMASGQAGRAGVFAALLARAGMEGPPRPFEGKTGWSDHVAKERFSLDTLGGKGTPFRIGDTLIKNRPAAASAVSLILAAEKIAPLENVADVQRITAEAHYGRYYQGTISKEYAGKGDRFWQPDSPGNANHSFPYVVAATLIDGTVTPRSFDEAHLANPVLRALMQKVDVVVNKAFAQAYGRVPQEHRARVTVELRSGERLVGETGGDADDLSAPRTKAQIEVKFRGLAEESLGVKRASAILERLWHLEDMANVAEIPPALAFA